MKYHYKLESTKSKKYNRFVTVYHLGDNGYFVKIGEAKAHSEAWVGDLATVAHILHDKLKFELTEDEYSLADKSIDLIRLP